MLILRYAISPQGFLPTLLEDVPDMAVKFAVYESMRTIYAQIFGREVCIHVLGIKVGLRWDSQSVDFKAWQSMGLGDLSTVHSPHYSPMRQRT